MVDLRHWHPGGGGPRLKRTSLPGCTMKKSPKVLQDLRTLERELADRLERIRRDRMRAGQPLSAHFTEQAVERENDEVLDRLETATAAELRQVERAVAHFEAGLYGLCESCGAPIEERRLHRLPYATACAHCAPLRQAAA